LADVLQALSDVDALRTLSSLVPQAQRDRELEPIIGRWKDFQIESSGMRAQLDTLLMTDFGELLASAAPTLDLADVYANHGIAYFALPVARFPQTGPLVAKLIIGDLNAVAGLVQDGELPKGFQSVVIDEFAAFAMPEFVDLLNKARSAGMAMTISHQSMRGDLEGISEGYVGQVADNTNVKICLRQTDDAEYVAGLGGTRTVVKRTEQTQATFLGDSQTGLGSARDAEEYRVSPNVVRELPQGVAVVKVDQPSRMLDLVALDFFDSSKLPAYDPPPVDRPSSFGLNLLARTLLPSVGDAPSPPALTQCFEGA
jgi:type IV secretory pathway TraG/TraD family ATPase VirD4